MSSVRVFFIGGLMSYRAMFGWMSPWTLIPSLVVSPVFQVLLFAYIGRSAGVADDQFYVIGNALNYAAIPCLFAMSSVIEGEREGHTLGIVFATPARRIPLFLGRAVPVVVNGWATAVVGLVAGALLLHVTIAAAAWPAVLLTVVVTSVSCTGLGLTMGAITLRVREGAVIGNVVFCLLLVFCGVNVAVADLPAWMAHVGAWLPLTHGIQAARLVAAGRSPAEVGGLLTRELGVGVLYTVVGLVLLRWLEDQSRRYATLERT